MRKKLYKLMEKTNQFYLTENPINFNDDRDYGYKYFLCWHNTHSIHARTKSLHAMIEIVEDLLKGAN